MSKCSTYVPRPLRCNFFASAEYSGRGPVIEPGPDFPMIATEPSFPVAAGRAEGVAGFFSGGVEEAIAVVLMDPFRKVVESCMSRPFIVTCAVLPSAFGVSVHVISPGTPECQEMVFPLILSGRF